MGRREGRKERGEEGEREGRREGRKKGGKEGRREGRRKGGKEGGEEGGRKKRSSLPCHTSLANRWFAISILYLANLFKASNNLAYSTYIRSQTPLSQLAGQNPLLS